MKSIISRPVSAIALSLCLASPAVAQTFGGNVATLPPVTGVFTPNAPATATVTGDAAVAPFIVTTTTEQTGTVDITAGGVDFLGPIAVNGNIYGGIVVGIATGTDGAVSTTVTDVDYTDPANPLSTVTPPVLTLDGAPALTDLNVVGAAGLSNLQGGVMFGSNIEDDGVVDGNSVGVTENAITVTTSGVNFATYQGTATYDPATGIDIVLDPTAVNNSTFGATGPTARSPWLAVRLALSR